MSSQWLLVWLCFTRIASVTWPFQLRALISLRATSIAIVGAVLFAMATSSFTLWTFSVARGTCTAFAGSSSGQFRLALLGGTQYIVSTLVLLLLSIVLAFRLLGIARQRRALHDSSRESTFLKASVAGSGEENRASKQAVGMKELRMAVTILLMAALHLCVHVVGAGLWAMLYFDATSGLSPRIKQTMASVASVVDTVSICIRLWNFYAYLVTIPTFRAAVLFGVTCGRCSSSRSHAPHGPTTDSMASLAKAKQDCTKSPEKSTTQI